MSVQRIPVCTTKLSIGMFISMLDRPWLETPFIFQGFEIRDPAEIEQLQSYCSQVYVDVKRGSLSEARIRALAAGGSRNALPRRAAGAARPRPGLLARCAARIGLARLLPAAARTGETYPAETTARREAPRARQAWLRAVAHHRTIADRARRIGSVDADAVASAIGPAIDSIVRNPDAMAWTAFSLKRSPDYSRPVATAVWSTIFGRSLGLPLADLRKLATGGFLLDIGNVTLPDDLVYAEGAMSQEDYAKIPQHVQAGVDILLRSRGVDPDVIAMVHTHHERFDGSGYPQGLLGGEIPPFGRIAGIADCYDAMTTQTRYSPALAAYDAARELNEMRGKVFHDEVVAQFLQAIGMFPTGSIVELNDGRIAIVLEQNRDNRLQPKLLILRSERGEWVRPPRVMNPEDWPSGDAARWLCIDRGHEHGAFGIDPARFFNR